MVSTRARAVAVAAAVFLLMAGLPVPGTAAEETTIDREGDRVTLESGPGQVVAGNTSLPAGTTVSVRLQSSSDTPFLMTRSATVTADGRFRAVFDLSDAPADTIFEVTVHHDGETLGTAPGRVAVCRAACDVPTPTTPSADLDRDGNLITLGTGAGQVITGTTNLPPGATVVVRTRSTAGANPFIKSRETAVTADGRFYAVFDFDDIGENTSFRAAVRHNGSELTSASGEVLKCPDCETDEGTATPASLGVIEVTRGDVARIPFAVDAPVTVTVGEFAGGFTVAATARDADGDGEVTLELPTAGSATERVRAAGADEADAVLAQGDPGLTDYEIRVYAGTDVGVGERDDDDRILAEGALVVLGGTEETPVVTFSAAGDGGGPPLDVAGALAVGGVLGVLGVGLLVGLLRP